MRVRSTIMLLAVLAGCGTKPVETAKKQVRVGQVAAEVPATAVSTHPTTDLKRTWNLAVWDQARWWGAVEVETARSEPVAARAHVKVPLVVSATSSVNGYPCGGDLPSCCTLQKESGGTPTAQNPVSSSSGLWQFTDDTWGGYGGYQHAKDAPANVQNERARQVFAGGAGASNWYGDSCYAGG